MKILENDLWSFEFEYFGIFIIETIKALNWRCAWWIHSWKRSRFIGSILNVFPTIKCNLKQLKQNIKKIQIIQYKID